MEVSRVLLVLVLSFVASNARATSVTHHIPPSELVCESEMVAVVEITGGHNPDDDKWVYKAKVVQTIRGEANGNTIYFAPPYKNHDDEFSYKLGALYLVVLGDSEGNIIDPAGSMSPLGESERGQHYMIGLGPSIVMPIEVRCDFDECEEEIALSFYIKLPEDFPSFAKDEECGHDLQGATWVQKDKFVASLLEIRQTCP